MARPSLYNPKARNRDYLYPESEPKPIRGDDLDNVTLQSGEWITVWTSKVDADTAEFWGYGPRNREAASASFAYAEFLANGNGTGADGDAINGEVRLAIQDSTNDDIRRRRIGTCSDLADAKSESRTERPMMAEWQPAASEDKYLALQIKVSSGSDGVELANDSNILLHYGLHSGV